MSVMVRLLWLVTMASLALVSCGREQKHNVPTVGPPPTTDIVTGPVADTRQVVSTQQPAPDTLPTRQPRATTQATSRPTGTAASQPEHQPASAPTGPESVTDINSGLARLDQVKQQLADTTLSSQQKQALTSELLRTSVVLSAVALWRDDNALAKRIVTAAGADSLRTLADRLVPAGATSQPTLPPALSKLAGAAAVMAALGGSGVVQWSDWEQAARRSDSVGAAVRLATAARAKRAIAALDKSLPEVALAELVGLLGPVVCAECASQPPKSQSQPAIQPAGLKPSISPQSVLCEKAKKKLEGSSSFVFSRLVVQSCSAADYGLASAGDLVGLGPENGFYTRVLASLNTVSTAVGTGVDPILRQPLEWATGALKQKAAAMQLPLFVPWSGPPASQLFKQTPPSGELTPVGLESNTAVHCEPLPLQSLIVGPAEVRLTHRPIARLTKEGVSLSDKGDTYAFPGHVAADQEAIERGDKERAKKPEKPADRDVIDGFAEQVTAFEAATFPLEGKVFANVEPALTNAKRGDKPKSITIGVDAFAPAWLLRRSLASLKHSGYEHILLLKGASPTFALQPIVFRTERGLPASVAFRSHSRPMIVHVTGRYVHVYPPEGPKRKASPLPPAVRWPRGVVRTMEPGSNTLFKVTVKVDEQLGQKLGQVVAKLRRINKSGNVVYVTVPPKVPAAKVLAVADAIASAPGKPIQELEAFGPGLQCRVDQCPTHVPVLFGRVRLPRQKFFQKKEKPVAKPKAGFCSRKKIARTVRRRAGAFRYCYERELQQNPGIKGKVIVQWKVQENGRVSDTSVVSSAIKVSRFQTCLMDKIRRLRFPKPEGGVCVVRWPFVFTR